MKKDFIKGLGFLIGCILLMGSPHLTFASMVILHPDAVSSNTARVVSIFSLLGYPVPVLLGLYAFFIGVMLIWKCNDAKKFGAKKRTI